MNLSHLSLLCLGIFAGAFGSALQPTTPDPEVKGVTMIGPAPWYECTANGAFPHEDKCEYFYDCYNDVAWLALCTEVQLFDLTFSGCNWAASVDCGDRVRPDDYPPPPFQCPAPSGYFANPYDCSAFIVCENSVPFHHDCPNNFLYDSLNRWCDYPHNVDCGDRPIPTA